MRLTFLILAPLALVACAETGGATMSGTGTGGRDVGSLPEAVVAAAAPYQDLTSVRIDETGCYVYLYAGPVETTWLPLRTRDGRPICTRAQG